MYISFYGAVREVTGSMHMLCSGQDRILMDCGMYQGHRKESDRKNHMMFFDPDIITNIILSHAHIDHSGRIPVVTKNGFKGHIISTSATADACKYLLADSAHIQESDAKYLNYKTVRSFLHKMKSGKNGSVSKKTIEEIKTLLKKDKYEIKTEIIDELMNKHQLEKVEPLYTIPEAEHALTFFEGYPYNYKINIGKEMTCKFYDAGHILGSAITIIKINKNGKNYNVCYTGDIGRFNRPILKNPCMKFDQEDQDIDFMIMESTYGNRYHEPVEGLKGGLRQIVLDTYNRGGTLLIPSFAYGRTQELVYVLHQLYNEKKIPGIPLYVDSPLARNLTKVFGEHPELYDKETHKIFLEKGKNPFTFDKIKYVKSVEESMTLMHDKTPHIVIAASGMCEAGRILHHLRCKIHNEKNTILVVGYMAQNTLGRRILELGREYEKSGRSGPFPVLKFLNKTYPLKAHVEKLGGFSAHADKSELLNFLQKSNLRIKKIAVVHGEEDQSIAFVNELKRLNYDAFVPHIGEIVPVI